MGKGYSRVIRAVLLLCCVALVVSAPAAAQAPAGFWGVTYTTSTNERVTIHLSTSYPVDDAAAQRWANFMASLVHGPELATANVFIAPPAQVARMCGGREVYGCYSNNRIVAQGDEVDAQPTTSVLAHEYGHHIETNRSNDPWRASAWGTKRWSSYVQVCAKTETKQMFPGSQSALLYLFNPGEGFAEAYRLLNEKRLGLPHGRWLVDDLFLPDERALALIELDVLQPWSANTTVTLRGRYRTFRIATPLDGTFAVSAQGRPRVRIDVLAGKKRIARGTRSVSTLVCGARTLSVRVTRLASSGP